MLSTLKITLFAAMTVAGLALSGCDCAKPTPAPGGTEGGGGTKATTGGTTASMGSEGGGGTEAGDHKATDPSKPLKFAFVTNNSSDYWTIVQRGTEKAVKELGNVSVDFRLPQDPYAAKQREIVENVLTTGVDGIAISPADPKNQTDMLNDAASRTLVFTQDSDAPDSKRTCYIGTDNVAAGRQLGEELKKALPNGGKIVVFVGALDAQNAKERIGGLEEAIKGTNITIADRRADGADHAKAKSNVADILTSMPDVAGLVGIWSYNGPAILSAVEDAKKTGKVKILCFDEEKDTLRGVKSGAITTTIVQQPWEFGYQAVKNMAAYLRGDKSVVPTGGKVIIPTKVINRGTVGEFETYINKKRAGE